MPLRVSFNCKYLPIILFLFTVIRFVNVCHSYKVPTNATDQQLLEGNPSLKELYDKYVDSDDKISSVGLKRLVEHLIAVTACPLPNQCNQNQAGISEDHIKHNNREEVHESNSVEHENKHNGELHDSHDHDHDNHHDHKDDHNVAPLKGNSDENDLRSEDSSTKECRKSIETAIANIDVLQSGEYEFGAQTLLHACPSILLSLLDPPCAESESERSRLKDSGDSVESRKGYDNHNHDHHHRKQKEKKMTKDAWIGAGLSMVLIGLISLACIMVIPVLKRSKYYVMVNHFLLALAVGSLAGDALIHLLPHALTMEIDSGMNAHLLHALYGFTAFIGILLFLLMERLHNMIGHKHSHGHAHDINDDADEFVKEIGVLSAELNEIPKNMDKVLEKHSSFIFTDATSPSEIYGCFESCPPNLGPPGSEDANGNNGVNAVICKPRVTDHNLASDAECERLVAVQRDKLDEESATKGTAPIPAATLVQSSPPKPMVRQDSKNFNMVLQEYHVGHHGHSHHGHSHVTGKKDSLRTMILLGDGMHTLMDGMAIGAAFGSSLTGGIATAIAVLCHELPHKVGDFAILFEMGMKRNQALKMVVILWLLSLAGLAVGVFIGSIHEVSPWIYCFTAGVFLYLALVDLLSELSINGNETCSSASQMTLQVAGMMTGAIIMLVIAIYEHNLEDLLEGVL